MNMSIGKLRHGERNLISDVPGVRVGHSTVDRDDYHTGVTVVLPPQHNPFTEKLTAASCVFNGYGKTLGLVQVDELGSLETPIALTNTLNVGKVHDALVSYMIGLCREDGIRLTSGEPFSASALHYTVESLDSGPEKQQMHGAEIPQAPLTNLLVDKVQMGLGCVDSWMSVPRPEYMLPSGKYQFTVKIERL